MSLAPDQPDFLDTARRFLADRRTRLVLAWLACLGLAAQRWHHARHMFDSPPEPAERARADGNLGHTHIDFGGQWVFGRMAVTGRLHRLYHRDAHWEVVREGFPVERQSPAARDHSFPVDARPSNLTPDDLKLDRDVLMTSMMGDTNELKVMTPVADAVAIALSGGLDGNPFAAAATQHASAARIPPETLEAVKSPLLGGPLYPPVHAFLYAPLASIPNPQTAYFLFQWILMAAAFFSGWMIRVISNGRVWWPIATTLVLLYPGGRPGLDLAQNNILTLAIVLGGWALAVRGRDYTGGLVWGLLAFKPVWGLAFILVPLLMRRWRFVGGTATSGFALVFLTLPFVGVQGWRDWLTVGKDANELYKVNTNWVNLSRDLAGLPRRVMLDFGIADQFQRNTPEAEFASNACLAVVFLVTVAVYLWKGDWRKPTGLSAGFLVFGGYLCCYRFMYYDAMLSVAGFAVLLANPNWVRRERAAEFRTPTDPPTGRRLTAVLNSVPLTVLVMLLVYDNILIGVTPQATFNVNRLTYATKDRDGKDIIATPKVTLAGDYNHPIDTFLILGLWAWCGWRLVRDGRAADEESVHAGESASSASSAAPMSGDRMSDSPTSTA